MFNLCTLSATLSKITAGSASVCFYFVCLCNYVQPVMVDYCVTVVVGWVKITSQTRITENQTNLCSHTMCSPFEILVHVHVVYIPAAVLLKFILDRFRYDRILFLTFYLNSYRAVIGPTAYLNLCRTVIGTTGFLSELSA